MDSNLSKCEQLESYLFAFYGQINDCYLEMPHVINFCRFESSFQRHNANLGSYFKEKGIQFGAEHLIRFSTRHVAFIQSWHEGKENFIITKSSP